MRHFLCLLLLCQLLLIPFITQAQSYSENDKEGLRLWLRQVSSASDTPNFQCLGLTVSDTTDWNIAERWLDKLQEPRALSYIDWEWDMATPANLVRLEIKTFDDSKSPIAGDMNCSYFSYLQELDCSNTLIQSIDLSTNIRLRKLNCSNAYLTNLNINACSVLSSLDCSGNQLNSLMLTQNLALQYLNCSDNNLETLDITDNVDIHTLSCAKNKLYRLNLPQSVTLESIDCSENNLVSLNISKYLNLKLLSIGNNQLSNIDFSGNTALLSLYTHSNELSSINLSSNNAVKVLDVSNNFLKVLDVTPHNELEYLLCPNNELESLDVQANTNLKELNCGFNSLSEIIHSTETSNLYSFRGNDNYLKFSTLPVAFVRPSMAERIYAPQADWDGGEVPFSSPIDLSSEFEIQGEKTSYAWAYDLDARPAMMPNDNNGVFYATINDDYFSFCKLTNPLFPDLELSYKVKILKDTLVGISTEKSDADVVLYYEKASQLLKIVCSENILSMSLYDTMGRCLLSVSDLGSDASVPVLNPHPGVYIARITTESKKSVTQKISIY